MKWYSGLIDVVILLVCLFVVLFSIVALLDLTLNAPKRYDTTLAQCLSTELTESQCRFILDH